ncbi:MAG TPA: M1 family metallopeptidase [Candidatus Limnocylindrales bacterium]
MRYRPLIVAALALVLAGCTKSPTITNPPSPQASKAPAIDYAAWKAGQSQPVADPIYPARGNDAIDVLHYGLDLAWAPESKTLTGQATLRLRATRDLTEIKLDLSQKYQLDGVTLDGAASAGAVASDKLTVATTLTKDSNATLVVKYHGTPEPVKAPTGRGDFEALGLTITPEGGLWTMQEPFGAFTWYPVNDQPSDKALYDIAITVPDGWAGVAGGTPAGQEGNKFKYTTTDPMSSYLSTLAVGKYTKETATGPGGLPITYWFRPGTDDAIMKTVRNTPRYLEWLESKFGKYPFPSAGVVLVPSASAMETQQMVTMGTPKASNPSQNASYWEGILVHEFAHHWFGDTVTTNNWNDLWLNEGWAMYAQYLFQNERDKISDAEFERWARPQDGSLRARYGPPGKADPKDFGRSNMYVCPALMLHQIRKKIGNEEFFGLAKGWAADNRNTAKDRAGFIGYVNQRTGTDFGDLINSWLDSPTTPPSL